MLSTERSEISGQHRLLVQGPLYRLSTQCYPAGTHPRPPIPPELTFLLEDSIHRTVLGRSVLGEHPVEAKRRARKEG